MTWEPEDFICGPDENCPACGGRGQGIAITGLSVICEDCDGSGRLTELVERALAVERFTIRANPQATTTPENVEEQT